MSIAYCAQFIQSAVCIMMVYIENPMHMTETQLNKMSGTRCKCKLWSSFIVLWVKLNAYNAQRLQCIMHT
jgi:hypothetical protein